MKPEFGYLRISGAPRTDGIRNDLGKLPSRSPTELLDSLLRRGDERGRIARTTRSDRVRYLTTHRAENFVEHLLHRRSALRAEVHRADRFTTRKRRKSREMSIGEIHHVYVVPLARAVTRRVVLAVQYERRTHPERRIDRQR